MGVGRAQRVLRGRLQVADTNHIPGALLCNPPTCQGHLGAQAMLEPNPVW